MVVPPGVGQRPDFLARAINGDPVAHDVSSRLAHLRTDSGLGGSWIEAATGVVEMDHCSRWSPDRHC